MKKFLLAQLPEFASIRKPKLTRIHQPKIFTLSIFSFISYFQLSKVFFQNQKYFLMLLLDELLYQPITRKYLKSKSLDDTFNPNSTDLPELRDLPEGAILPPYYIFPNVVL